MSDLGPRVVWAIPAIVFALVIVLSGGWVFAAGAALLGLFCLHELYRMYDRVQPIRIGGFLGLLGLAVAARAGDTTQVLLALSAGVALTFLFGLAAPSRRLTASLSLTLLGLFWIGLGIAHAILLRDLPRGEDIMIDVLVGTFLGDTGAYLGGRAFGRRRLAPHISPHKTVEGLVIGMLVAVLAVWCAGLYQDWLTHGQALLLGLAVAVTAPIGDLFESKVKRDAQAKDAGSLFGAHGGALDRLDAVLFSLVAGYYVWLAML
jgi:phosphatidate cytidylyltransferase